MIANRKELVKVVHVERKKNMKVSNIKDIDKFFASSRQLRWQGGIK